MPIIGWEVRLTYCTQIQQSSEIDKIDIMQADGEFMSNPYRAGGL